MFLDWEKRYGVKEKLLSAAEYHPYPTAAQRELWESLDNKERTSYIQEAKKYESFTWPMLLATDFMAFHRIGERLIYETPHFKRRKALVHLVIGECMQGQGAFLDDIINGIWLICEESYWGISAHNGKEAFLDNATAKKLLPNAETPYIDLFAAETGALLAWTAYLLKQQLNEYAPQVCQRIEYELERRIKYPFMTSNETNWMGFLKTNKVNNWNPWINSNVLAVFLLIEVDENRRNQAVIRIFEILDFFMATYGSDGGCDEGTSYWGHAAGCVHDCCEQLYKASDGAINFFEEVLIKEMGRFIYREHIHQAYFVNFADGAAKADCDAKKIYNYGVRIKDEKMQNTALALPNAEKTEDWKRAPAIFHVLLQLFDCRRFEEKKKTATAPYIKEAWLKDIQVMTARENAGTHKGLYLAAKGGHNDENHNHNDIGTYLVYYDGEPAIIDLGVGIYTKQTFSSKRYEIWTMQSGYHNLPIVNGVMQAAGAEFQAKNVICRQTEDEASLSMDLSHAYPKRSGLKTLERAISLIRMSGAGSIQISEQYYFEKAGNQITQVLMCAKKPQVLSAGKLRVRGSKQSLIITHNPLGKVELEKCKIKDKRLEAVWGTSVYRITIDLVIETDILENMITIGEEET